MEIEDLLENDCSQDELLAFLSAYVPNAYSNVKNNSLPKINSKKMDDLIVGGPKSYINPVCIEACEDLWNKNIYILASIDINGDLYLILDKLDKENMKIFSSKYKENPNNYCANVGHGKHYAIKLEDYEKYENARTIFQDLVSIFVMQDIQRGYLTEKTFLMNICNCEKVEGLTEYKKQDLQVVFDINKMEKSFKEYLKDSGYENYYVPKEHRIYLNEYYYNAHQNYKRCLG